MQETLNLIHSASKNVRMGFTPSRRIGFLFVALRLQRTIFHFALKWPSCAGEASEGLGPYGSTCRALVRQSHFVIPRNGIWPSFLHGFCSPFCDIASNKEFERMVRCPKTVPAHVISESRGYDLGSFLFPVLHSPLLLATGTLCWSGPNFCLNMR